MSSRQLTPLGALLEEARINVLRISASEAARRAQMSESRWRQVVTGVQRKAGGSVPVNPTDRTVVAMACATGVDPAEALKAAGRSGISQESIAAIVDEIRQPAPGARLDGLADELERIRNLRGVSPEDKIRMVKVLVDLHEERAASAEGS
jgi:uncharacterized OsmC-like protein